MSRVIVALLAIAAVVGAGAASGAGAQSPAATKSAATKPPIHKMLIPYPKKRKREMAAYSKRHYGQYKWRLNNPKVIVIHYAAAGSISAIFNTFSTDQPDVEFHELPNVCSHYAVAASGAVYKFVPPTIRCRHTVGLNWTAIGVEHVGFSDQDILNRPAQLNGSLHFVAVAPLPVRHPGLQRHRAQREPLLAVLQGARPALPGPDPRRLEPRRHADLPRRPDQARQLLSRVRR